MGVWAAVLLVGLAMVLGSPYGKEDAGSFPREDSFPIDDDDLGHSHPGDPDDHA